jgi:hypothetical protein
MLSATFFFSCCRLRLVLAQPVQEWRHVCVFTTRAVLLQVSTVLTFRTCALTMVVVLVVEL